MIIGKYVWNTSVISKLFIYHDIKILSIMFLMCTFEFVCYVNKTDIIINNKSSSFSQAKYMPLRFKAYFCS